MITHADQKRIWEKEHAEPLVLPQLDSPQPSGGVVLFWQWLKEKGIAGQELRGLEMGCGKGRNCIWLAQQSVNMTGFDFSENAIKEARQRALGINNVKFIVHDATAAWPWRDDTFDLAIDCFASTDIESEAGRTFARREFKRALKPGGYLLVYTLSTDDEFHQETIRESPGPEKNTMLHPSTGKFEKVFDGPEIKEIYQDWLWLEERRIPKKVNFFGKDYDCLHWWLVLQKI